MTWRGMGIKELGVLTGLVVEGSRGLGASVPGLESGGVGLVGGPQAMSRSRMTGLRVADHGLAVMRSGFYG